ncbi:hypothetical protein [Morganella psychrotolerans]|uniref:hypothetical protein n=1 Tax=Morganella psychrotolerans TaxID=368603 RepID=UPI000A5AC4B9|nr:hypothetical protein [Morganella psychrotolerans]
MRGHNGGVNGQADFELPLVALDKNRYPDKKRGNPETLPRIIQIIHQCPAVIILLNDFIYFIVSINRIAAGCERIPCLYIKYISKKRPQPLFLLHSVFMQQVQCVNNTYIPLFIQTAGSLAA